MAYFVGNAEHSIWLGDRGDCPALEVQLLGMISIVPSGAPKSLSSTESSYNSQAKTVRTSQSSFNIIFAFR